MLVTRSDRNRRRKRKVWQGMGNLEARIFRLERLLGKKDEKPEFRINWFEGPIPTKEEQREAYRRTGVKHIYVTWNED